MIRRLFRDRTGTVRPKDTPLAVRVTGTAGRADETPPRPPMSARNVQHGIHDCRYDPCGAPAIAISKSGGPA